MQILLGKIWIKVGGIVQVVFFMDLMYCIGS